MSTLGSNDCAIARTFAHSVDPATRVALGTQALVHVDAIHAWGLRAATRHPCTLVHVCHATSKGQDGGSMSVLDVAQGQAGTHFGKVCCARRRSIPWRRSTRTRPAGRCSGLRHHTSHRCSALRSRGALLLCSAWAWARNSTPTHIGSGIVRWRHACTGGEDTQLTWASGVEA